MTKESALHSFFGSFGITAYKSTAVPDDVTFPYLTYTDEYNGFYDAPTSISVHIYYYTDSEAVLNAEVRKIEDKLGNGGCIVNYDGGAVWLTKGTPWCTSTNDSTDPTIKGRFLNIYRSELSSI